jgi:hypothetical protein
MFALMTNRRRILRNLAMGGSSTEKSDMRH